MKKTALTAGEYLGALQFRSTDGGSTWGEIIALEDAPPSFERLAVCHAPSNGDFAYAFSKDKYGIAALWCRTAFNGTFGRVLCPKGINVTQIGYDWFAAVSPASQDVVYLGAVSLWRGERKQDGTWTWQNISSRTSGDGIHPDQHAIAFSASDAQVLYVGNDGGIFKSADAGKNWESLNKGLCITHFEYIAQHPDLDAWLLGGTQDNGTLRYEGGEVWYQVAQGDGGECATNHSSPYTVYHCFDGMTIERSLTGGGSGSWTRVGQNVPESYGKLFYPPMEVDGNLVVQAGETVFASTDTGTTFQELALPEDAGIATAVWLCGPFRILVGTNSGDLFQFDWIDNGWASPVNLGQPRAGFISSIREDRRKAGHLWVTYSDILGPTVYRSEDGGDSWVPCMNGLPKVAANVVEIDPLEMNTIYIGTDVGVWRSTNAGDQCSWTILSNGLPNAIIGDLLFHSKARILRAATRSRGVWELDLSTAQTPDVQLYLRHSAVDTGRQYPSLEGAMNPFVPGAKSNWWECIDILLDSEPYWLTSLGHLDFVEFEEKRRAEPKTAHGNTHVFVQVHQRGPIGATNVVVHLFYAITEGDNVPALPEHFWGNAGLTLPNGSVWSAVGSSVSLGSLQTGQPKIAAFQWMVPTSKSGSAWLLAIMSAGNDKLETSELNPAVLGRNEPKCGLKRVSIAT